MLLLWTIFVFYVSFVSLLFCRVCFLQPCGHLLSSWLSWVLFFVSPVLLEWPNVHKYMTPMDWRPARSLYLYPPPLRKREEMVNYLKVSNNLNILHDCLSFAKYSEANELVASHMSICWYSWRPFASLDHLLNLNMKHFTCFLILYFVCVISPTRWDHLHSVITIAVDALMGLHPW